MIIDNVQQGTQEWLNLKAGVPSASNFDKIVTMTGKPSDSAKKYMYQLAGERITGIREEGYQSSAMARGIELEPEAVALYELSRGVKTSVVGIVYPNDKKEVLCSPDRLVGANEGLLEVKNPLLTTHVGYLLDNQKLVSTYYQQIHGQMYVTGLPWCDIMAHYPAMNPVIVRVEREEGFIKKLHDALQVFCEELEDCVKRIS